MVVTVDIPDKLKTELEQRAQVICGPGGINDAVAAAIRLWLIQTEQDLVATERRLNNAAYQRLGDQLERDYAGKYAVIAHGELQRVVDSPEEARDVARDAYHRLVFKIGDHPPKERSLGWKIRPGFGRDILGQSGISGWIAICAPVQVAAGWAGGSGVPAVGVDCP